MHSPVDPQLFRESDRRLTRTVDALSPDAWGGPSLLPGWTRAHVVAHLALNAEGLARVLAGLRASEPPTMYDSDRARDDDIEALATAGEDEVRERLMAATTDLGRRLESLSDTDAAQRFERTPGGRRIRVGAIALMRWREVEIHHADLDAGYSPADWPTAFSQALIESMTARDWPRAFQVVARDLARTWHFGQGGGGPVVTGDVGPLGWWLTGRPAVGDVAPNEGPLPDVPPW